MSFDFDFDFDARVASFVREYDRCVDGANGVGWNGRLYFEAVVRMLLCDGTHHPQVQPRPEVLYRPPPPEDRVFTLD